MKKVFVQSNANIALIKYWGKRDEKLFLPTKSSLSVTLSGLCTLTSVQTINSLRADNSLNSDIVYINNYPAPPVAKENIVKFLDLFRRQYAIKSYFKIETENKFPTAAGLASSASGFSALAFALSEVCGLNLSKQQLSILARRGSGSASRSIFGGFALLNKGEKNDGSDSFAQQVVDENYWPDFCVLVVIVSDQEKKISSRVAMQITVNTSDYYSDWLIESEKKLPIMVRAIKEKDFNTVGKLAQSDCLWMHKTMQTSKPSINYWQPATLQIMKAVNKLRAGDLDCYFTIDAGPNVKVLCLKKDIERILRVISAIDGVQKIITSSVGCGVCLQ